MSSWERSRYLPWDRIPLPDTRVRQPGEAPPPSLEDQRERIIRQLQRESFLKQQKAEVNAIEVSNASNLNETNNDMNASSTTPSNKKKIEEENRVIYSHMDLLRQAALGGCIGTITGTVFGFMDGMRNAGELPILQKASNMSKLRYILQGTTRSATLFGSFFGCYHTIRYGVRVTINPSSEYSEIALASPIALGVLWSYKPTRHAFPYGAMLVIMDGVSLYMRKPI